VWSVNGVLSISSSPPSLGLAIVSVWPRLQSSQERPPWLRVDFDHWEELSDGEEGAEGGGEDDGDATTGHKKPLPRERLEEIKKKQAQMMSEMEKVKKEATQLWKTVDTAKKAYLLLYNGVQWAGFILIVMSLLKCLTKGRGVSLSFTVSVVFIYLSGKSPFYNARQHLIRQQCNAIL
jgi:hypothetical protein